MDCAEYSESTYFSDLNYVCANVLFLRNLQEQVKKHSVSKIVLTFHCTNNFGIKSLFHLKFLEISTRFTIEISRN